MHTIAGHPHFQITHDDCCRLMSLRPVDLDYLDRHRRLLSYSLVVQAWVQLCRARANGNVSPTD